MRVYIAADSFLQEEVRVLRNKLRSRGIEVTSHWIDAKLENLTVGITEKQLEDAATNNFDDIDRAAYLIAYNPLKRHKQGTGGRHVEMGYALAKFKKVLYVGEKLENVFHRHPNVIWVCDFSDSIDAAIPLVHTVERLWNEYMRQPSDR
jgi:hypothetical protein